MIEPQLQAESGDKYYTIVIICFLGERDNYSSPERERKRETIIIRPQTEYSTWCLLFSFDQFPITNGSSLPSPQKCFHSKSLSPSNNGTNNCPSIALQLPKM